MFKNRKVPVLCHICCGFFCCCKSVGPEVEWNDFVVPVSRDSDLASYDLENMGRKYLEKIYPKLGKSMSDDTAADFAVWLNRNDNGKNIKAALDNNFKNFEVVDSDNPILGKCAMTVCPVNKDEYIGVYSGDIVLQGSVEMNDEETHVYGFSLPGRLAIKPSLDRLTTAHRFPHLKSCQEALVSNQVSSKSTAKPDGSLLQPLMPGAGSKKHADSNVLTANLIVQAFQLPLLYRHKPSERPHQLFVQVFKTDSEISGGSLVGWDYGPSYWQPERGVDPLEVIKLEDGSYITSEGNQVKFTECGAPADLSMLRN